MTYLSALAELVDGRFKVLAGSDDFKDGLMVVKSEADARLAAAAIMTLQMRKLSGFGTLGAEQVKVTKTDKGWTCQFGRIYYFSGTVTFDAAGKLSGVSAHFFLPPPE